MADRNQFLGLSRNVFKAYKGNRDVLDEMPPIEGVPKTTGELPGRITAGDLDHPEVDDVLEVLGARVLKTGGEVMIVPAERMPRRTGAAAIYRF